MCTSYGGICIGHEHILCLTMTYITTNIMLNRAFVVFHIMQIQMPESDEKSVRAAYESEKLEVIKRLF